MTIVYFDCVGGAAGDMILGALLDAGAPFDQVRDAVAALDIGCEIRARDVTRAGVRATKVEVAALDDAPARSYREIRSLIDDANLDSPVRERALNAFRLLAEAEASVHRRPLEQVHLHEVGAVDALADIVGSCAALQWFAPREIVTSPIPVGSGTVAAVHGRLPVPAPAVTEILKGADVVPGGDGETITPTGAALLASWSDRFGSLPAMTLQSTGFGAGTRDGSLPNVTRVLVGQAANARSSGEVLLVETNVDDMNPELWPNVVESLIAAGAHDAWTTPILMKKGRHGVMLSVLCSPGDKDRITDVIYRETTTFGTRSVRVGKDELDRSWTEVTVEGHPVRVKVGRRGSETVAMAPEHDDALRAARATGMALKDVYAAAVAAAGLGVRRSV